MSGTIVCIVEALFTRNREVALEAAVVTLRTDLLICNCIARLLTAESHLAVVVVTIWNLHALHRTVVPSNAGRTGHRLSISAGLAWLRYGAPKRT